MGVLELLKRSELARDAVTHINPTIVNEQTLTNAEARFSRQADPRNS